MCIWRIQTMKRAWLFLIKIFKYFKSDCKSLNWYFYPCEYELLYQHLLLKSQLDKTDLYIERKNNFEKTKNLVVGSYPIVNKTQQQRSSLRKNMPCIVNFFLQSFFGFKNNIGILDRWTNTDTCLLRFQKICWPWKHELKNFTCFKKLPKYIPS